MRWIISVAILVASTSVAAPAQAASAEDKPNKTGCCFSFDNSPVNVLFCMTPDSCKIEKPK